VAADQKKAQKLRATIVLVDESGRSARPHRVRTWARRGQTPVLPFHFKGETLSVIAGMTSVQCDFRLFPGTIRGRQVVEFLAHRARHGRGKLILVGDRWPTHRSRLVQDDLAEHPRLQPAWRPASAPEFNPVEYLWGQLKMHPLGNCCAEHLGPLR
jgi:hypothetical protein